MNLFNQCAMNEIARIKSKGMAAALFLCCLAAVTGCARPDLADTTYLISREESVAILRAGLPDSDRDQGGIPDSLAPASHGSGVSDGGAGLWHLF